jgi:Xaa-Pro aminopeptidase
MATADAEPPIDEQLDRRRAALSSAWDLDSEVVVVGAGEPVPIPGRGDPTYPFRSHSEYLYLTDRERPGGVLAFDPHDGWIDFVAPVTRDELLWEGGMAPSAEDGVPATELEPWLEKRSGRPLVNLGAPVAGVSSDAALTSRLRANLNDLRRQKDDLELQRMRRAESATRAGFATAARTLEPGLTERALQIELEAEFFRAGADWLAFDTIIAAGTNSAVLHHPPTARPLAEGELVLIDAGGEYRGYASDVTRTYPVSGQFSGAQIGIYELVKKASEAAIERCGAGVEYRDVHHAAAVTIGAGLVDLGILGGEADTLVQRGTVSLFFPHGVGHMVGLGVRDAGGVLPGREPDPDAFPRLRADLPLLPGHVVTIEPGIYFVPALLNDPEVRDRHRDDVRWEQVERLLDFGGIRLEENVLITDDGVEVLTSDIPLAD